MNEKKLKELFKELVMIGDPMSILVGETLSKYTQIEVLKKYINDIVIANQLNELYKSVMKAKKELEKGSKNRKIERN